MTPTDIFCKCFILCLGLFIIINCLLFKLVDKFCYHRKKYIILKYQTKTKKYLAKRTVLFVIAFTNFIKIILIIQSSKKLYSIFSRNKSVAIFPKTKKLCFSKPMGFWIPDIFLEMTWLNQTYPGLWATRRSAPLSNQTWLP